MMQLCAVRRQGGTVPLPVQGYCFMQLQTALLQLAGLLFKICFQITVRAVMDSRLLAAGVTGQQGYSCKGYIQAPVWVYFHAAKLLRNQVSYVF